MLKPPKIKVFILSTSTKANGFNGYFLTQCNSNPKSKTIKAHIYILTAACILLSSCVKEKNTSAACHYDKPLEQIEWLRNIKNDMESSGMTDNFEIYSYSYFGNDYFLIDECKKCRDNQRLVYDCNQKLFCRDGGFAPDYSCRDFFFLGTNKRLLYSKQD